MGFFDRNSSAEIKSESVITEMCDVCGKDWPAPIPRFRYVDKRGLTFVIRHCPGCNPQLVLKRIGIEV